MCRLKQVCSYHINLFSNPYFTPSKWLEHNELAVSETKNFVNVRYTNVLRKPFSDESIITHQRNLLFATADKYTRECGWMISRVRVNMLASTSELTRGWGWIGSRARVNLLAGASELTRESIASECNVASERYRNLS